MLYFLSDEISLSLSSLSYPRISLSPANGGSHTEFSILCDESWSYSFNFSRFSKEVNITGTDLSLNNSVHFFLPLVFHLSLFFASLLHFISQTSPPATTSPFFFPLPSSPPVCNQGCEVSGQRKCSHISKGSWVLSGSGQEKEKVKLNTVGEDGGMRAELWRTVINKSSREAAALKGHWEQELILHCFVLYFLLETTIHSASLLSVHVFTETAMFWRIFGITLYFPYCQVSDQTQACV